MKKYFHHSPVALTKFALFVALFILISCKEKNVQAPANSVSQVKVKPPKIDLHTAVYTNNIEAVKQHIAAGSNLNEKDPLGGSSPLISACLFGKTDIARLLIDANADLNVRNNDGSTALLTAAFFGHPELVQLLLKKGADKTIKNKYGSTAYESVEAPFSVVKPTYDMLGKLLSPMGLKLDYAWLEKIRPQIAALLK